MKAYLVRRSVEFSDVHDIDTLRRLVATVDAELAAKLEPAAALTRYAVGTRYPGRYGTVTREQAEAAVQIAEAIRAEIQPLLNPDAQPPGGSLRERLRLQRSRGRNG